MRQRVRARRLQKFPGTMHASTQTPLSIEKPTLISQTPVITEQPAIVSPTSEKIGQESSSNYGSNSSNEKIRSFWAKHRRHILIASSFAGLGFFLFADEFGRNRVKDKVTEFTKRLPIDATTSAVVNSAHKIGNVVFPFSKNVIFTFSTFIEEFREAWPEIKASSPIYSELKAIIEEPRFRPFSAKPNMENRSESQKGENESKLIALLKAVYLMSTSAYESSSLENSYLKKPIDQLRFLFRAISSYIPDINFHRLFVYYSRVFLESVGFLFETSVWHLNSRTETLHPAELFVSIWKKVNNLMHYLALRSSILTLGDIRKFFVTLVAETYEMLLNLDLSVQGIKNIVSVFLESVNPIFVTASSMLKLSFAKPFINTFEDQNVSKAASYFLERTFKEPFVIDDILKILLNCIRNEQFVDEAKVLGKIIVQDAANDKVIEEELAQLFVRIFQTDDIKESAVNLIKFVFEQEDTKETLVQLFVNAFKDERILNSLKITLSAAMSEVVADPELQKKVSDFALVTLQPVLKAQLSKIEGLENKLSKPAESAEDIRTYVVDKMDLLKLISEAERQQNLPKNQNNPAQIYEDYLEEQEKMRRYDRLRLLEQVHNRDFSGFRSF